MNESTNLQVYPYAKGVAGVLVSRPGMQILFVLDRQQAEELAVHLDQQLTASEADDFEEPGR